MRHVMSLVAGAVLAPLIWVLVAAGQGAFQSGLSAEGAPSDLTMGLILLVGIGLGAGLIATLRTSPMGALLAGLVFIGASVYLYLDQAGALSVFTTTWQVKGYPINLALPLTNGVLAFAGALLIMSTFSAERWHSDDDEAEEEWTPIPQETQDYWSYR
ncbi:hypothetical protein [Rhizocola hellebori]|nr:hypothetical protein [Rhizocola hellebori]